MENKENFFKYLRNCEKLNAPCILNTKQKINWYREYIGQTEGGNKNEEKTLD